MRLSSIVAIYTLFWALSFFLVLPFRLRMPGEDRRVPGQADGAPPMFSVARTAKWTTLVAAILFGVYSGNYVYQWVPVGTFDFAHHPAFQPQ